MTALALAMVLGQGATAEAQLMAVRDHYLKLQSVRYRLVHHGYPGNRDIEIQERVYWSTPSHFEITPLTAPAPGHASQAKLVSDDGAVEAVAPDGSLQASKVNPGPDRVGLWELRGGMILVWVMHGKTWTILSTPNPTTDVSYEIGPKTSWHDKPVREVDLTRKTGKYEETTAFFLAAKADELVGVDAPIMGTDSWTSFEDVEEKPGS